MANYKPVLSCQNKFIPIDFSEQILPGTFEYALCYIVEHKLDLSGFDEWYDNDKTGAAAYLPKDPFIGLRPWVYQQSPYRKCL